MIKVQSGTLLTGVPAILQQETEVQALSHAVLQMMGEITQLSGQTRIFTTEEALTHRVCDLLAGEWKTPQYDDSYTLDVKRQLVRSTLSIYSFAGTKAAVEDLVSTIFGSAEIEEWYEYGGEPGYFHIMTDNPQVNSGDVDAFKEAAERVKRLSAWLEEIILMLSVDTAQLFTGVFMREYSMVEFECRG